MADVYEDDVSGNAVVLPNGTGMTNYTFTVVNLGAGSWTQNVGKYRENLDTIDGSIEFTKDATAGTGGAGLQVSLPNAWTATAGAIAGYVLSYNANTAVQYIVGVVAVDATDRNKLIFFKMNTNTVMVGGDVRAGSTVQIKITGLQIDQLAAQGAYRAYGAGQAFAARLGLVMGGTVPGKIDGQTIAAGMIGETIVASTTGNIAMTSAATLAVQTINLTPGKWLLKGHCLFSSGTGVTNTTVLNLQLEISTTNGSYVENDSYSCFGDPTQSTASARINTGDLEVNTSVPLTLYLNARLTLTAGSTPANYVAGARTIR
ncbi:MAG: hypothetical protein EOO39_38315, partial [Cytophagaceae bacterium]